MRHRMVKDLVDLIRNPDPSGGSDLTDKGDKGDNGDNGDNGDSNTAVLTLLRSNIAHSLWGMVRVLKNLSNRIGEKPIPLLAITPITRFRFE